MFLMLRLMRQSKLNRSILRMFAPAIAVFGFPLACLYSGTSHMLFLMVELVIVAIGLLLYVRRKWPVSAPLNILLLVLHFMFWSAVCGAGVFAGERYLNVSVKRDTSRPPPPDAFAPDGLGDIVAGMKFEKIWVKQCRATRRIKKQFGVKSALDYLLGEKLLMFAQAAENRSEFAAELPRFQAEVWNVFNPYELAGYLTTLKPTKRKKLQKLVYVNGSSKSRRST
jgi:hypothetical protein